MDNKILNQLIIEFKDINAKHIQTTLELLLDGNTIPFVARYRKEMTGSLDEVQIKALEDRYHYCVQLEQRKEEVLRLIDEQGKLTDELVTEISKATVLQTLEDVYRPYKQKRRTKATIAREKGLAPVALLFLESRDFDRDVEFMNVIDPERDVNTFEDVQLGVHEILAEIMGDDAKSREWVRQRMLDEALLITELKDASLDERHVYEMYYDFGIAVKRIAHHQVLALNRAEKEGVIRVKLQLDGERIHSYFENKYCKNKSEVVAETLRTAYLDALKRFIEPALEREIRGLLTERAETQAIAVFGDNLRHLLLQAPLFNKTILGFDPAYRTGCKLAIIDSTGALVAIDVIYPHKPARQHERDAAGPRFRQLIETYHVEMVAIGNGTASRESEQFVAEILKSIDRDVHFVIVNEAGASVYSASPEARAEFPDLQVEQRSAISIARRLQDPLAELVKIDPKSIGVGQYQHDVSQKGLKESLDFVVETAVNQVGVDVNTASTELLERISGLTKTTARNILDMRKELGKFSNRKQLKNVKRLGGKSYEQAVGFLRIPNGDTILDATGIHPECYNVTLRLLKDLDINTSKLGQEEVTLVLKQQNATQLAKHYEIGVETMQDILKALIAPGRDYRDDFEGPLLRSDVLTLEDLKPGMELKGTVRNVVDFGAFVDIGVKNDGLVHISKLAQKFVKHPSDVVSVGDIVTVWVDDVDVAKSRIQLSMIKK